MSALPPNTPRWIERRGDASSEQRLLAAGVHPVVARLLAARGIREAADNDLQTGRLLAPATMTGIAAAASRLADAIERAEAIVVVADYDCDGATACAVMLRGLRALGAHADYVVPNRFTHGYGLSPPIVDLAAHHPRLARPTALLVTVDNGIASVSGAARARELDIDVVVTDHHLAGQHLPEAVAIVNPNQPGCGFASKHLAGVGVAFYVLLALRAEMRVRGRFEAQAEPALQGLLDLVALGTVADLVKLDHNNRVLVSAGLRRIRGGKACAGVDALLRVAGRAPRACVSTDLGFAVGPRINAAGRLTDITIGIECLLTDDSERAAELAGQLDAINRERRGREVQMREQALVDAGTVDEEKLCVVVHRDEWHEGIVGLVASKLKDRWHRPAFALAPAAGEAGVWRGSGRSIPGLHLRDALDLVSKREPDLLERFGGHAMAAGLSIRAAHIERFAQALHAAVQTLADPSCFVRETATDGALAADQIGIALVDELERTVWGQGFPEPLFFDRFEIRQQRLLKERHSKLSVTLGGRTLDAIFFDHVEPLPAQCRLAYRLLRDDYRGNGAVQLQIVGIGH